MRGGMGFGFYNWDELCILLFVIIQLLELG